MIATGWALRPLRRLITRMAAGNRTRPTTSPVPGNISGPAHTPLEDRNGTGTTARGEPVVPVPSTFRGGAGTSQQPAAAPETSHMVGECAICEGLIERWTEHRVWTDPQGHVPAAHSSCLRRLGEKELLGLTALSGGGNAHEDDAARDDHHRRQPGT